MLQDVRFAFRQLVKNPGFSIIAILTLALAIGANTAIFSAVDAVLLHPLPYPHPEQLVILQENLPRHQLRKIAPNPAGFTEYRRVATCFTQMAALTATAATLTGGGHAEDVNGLRISAAAFPMLGVTPVAGGLFTAAEEQEGNDHVVLISEGLWKRRFGGDRSVIGKNIQINRESYRLAGVIRPILDFRIAADVWMPLVFSPRESAPGTNGPHNIDVIGRLKPGVTIEQARDEFRRIAARIVEQYPDQVSKDREFSIDLDPLAEKQAGDLKKPLLVLIAAVSAVMLIACANVSNLLLARSMMRRKEISIRAALGAGRGRVVRQLLTESVLLGLIAGAAGLLLALWGLHFYGQFGPRGLIRGPQPAVNAWVVGFSILLSMAASIVFGVVPAFETSRVDLNDALKEGSRGSSGGRRLLRESMVSLEVAALLVLLIGAGLLVRSFIRLAGTNPGFRSENVLTAGVSLPGANYREPAQRAAFARALLERARSLPGVRSAAIVDFIPYNGGAGSSIQIAGHPRDPNEPTQVVWQTRTSPGYFETAGIPLLRGRDLLPSDEQGAPPAAVIDETVARRFFANMDPIGMQVTLPIPRGTYTIVGLVGATKSGSPSAPPRPRIYYSGSEIPFLRVSLIVKLENRRVELVSALRHEVAALDPDLPVSFFTMDEILADSLARQRFSIQLMVVFAVVAAVLAAIGIYGVLAYLVDQRRRELGIRMALGARSGDVLALVLRQGAVPVVAGLALGVLGAFGMTWYLKSLLYEVSATDPVIFSGVSLALMFVALVAMSVPAGRATRVDPLEALRHE